MSIIFDLSAAALSSALTVQPIGSKRRGAPTACAKKEKNNKNLRELMVLVRRPMPGITMEQLLLPVLPSIKKKQPLSLANKVSLSTCKKSVVPLFWSTRSSKGRQMNSEHLLFCFVVIGFVFVTLNLRFVCGPCRIYQIPMSCIHPQIEMPVLSAPR